MISPLENSFPLPRRLDVCAFEDGGRDGLISLGKLII